MENLYFRIYGDNIIECIRIINMIKNNEYESFNEELVPLNQMSSKIILSNESYILTFELVPGFEKSAKKRWKENILDEYKKIGSTLDETADAIITKIEDTEERIISVIEFCSALQAGNQAWQRSGRAYSCARTGIPYFYIIDLPKYELDPETRERKALRFPNAVVPFSYISYSSINKTIAYEMIIKSQEYNENDEAFDGFDMETIFSNKELGNFLTAIITNRKTDDIVKSIEAKNQNFVNFLASENSSTSLSAEEINKLVPNSIANSIINSSKQFRFEKKIAKKSISGNLSSIHEVIKKYSVGIFSTDLPFGIIPNSQIANFLNEIKTIYPLKEEYEKDILSKDYLVIDMIKGFKPGGDDNRPDRGIMPLLRMLFGDEACILTVLYGPLIKSNYDLLISNKDKLAKSNGLWQTIIRLSDYLLFDCPIIGNKENKCGIEKMLKLTEDSVQDNVFKKLDLTPVNFREDDIDSLFYLLFSYESDAFYGICNPPGGDWSGFSIRQNGNEYRWLSLPRVSDDKRPDHVIQIDNKEGNPFLLIMESKEKPSDLETGIGPRLSQYIEWLLKSTPNVEFSNGQWKQSNATINFSDFISITSGSFISPNSIDYSNLLKTSDCDIIYSCILFENKWDVEIFYRKKEEVISFVEITTPIFENSKLINKVILKEVKGS